MKFKLQDIVLVTGGKDKGKSGEITAVFPDKHKVTVKGANLYKRHVKGREGLESTIITRERPLPVGNIALICQTCNKPTRIGYQLPPKGTKIRICKKCQSPIVTKSDTKKTKSKKK